MGLTVERAFISDIIDEEDTHGTTVICGCDGSEAFLASSIPNLKLHPFPVKFDGANLKVDTNGRDERRGKGVLAEPKQTA